GPRRDALSRPGPDRRAECSLAAREANRHRQAEPRPARAAAAGALPPPRPGQPARGPSARRRGAPPVTAELARLGGVLGSAGLAALLVATDRRIRIAGLVAWALGALLLAVYLLPHGHRAILAAAAVAGLLLAAAGAVALRRWPWALAIAALACFPARVPVTVGSTDANLLVPLYGVVAAAALALAWELLRADERARELGPVAWPLAAFVAWTGLSIGWVDDLRQGAIELLFFVLPFGLLAVSLARLPWSRRWLTFLYAQLALMALAFGVIGV